MDQELSHGGNHGTFVGLPTLQEAFHVCPDMRIVPGGRLGGHVEAFSDLRPASLEGRPEGVSPMKHDFGIQPPTGMQPPTAPSRDLLPVG